MWHDLTNIMLLIQGGDLLPTVRIFSENWSDMWYQRCFNHELSSGKQQLAMQHHRVRKLRIIWLNGPFSIAGNPSIWARNPATIPVNVFPDIIRISIHWEFPGITLQQMLSYIYILYIIYIYYIYIYYIIYIYWKSIANNLAFSVFMLTYWWTQCIFVAIK